MKKLLILSLLFVGFAAAQETGGVTGGETGGATAECEAGQRLFNHPDLAAEPVCIPENPERIVVLDQGAMVNLLVLGTRPAGVMDWGNRDYAGYLDIDPSTIQSVGTPEGPNYEAIVALGPDLILGATENVQYFGDNAVESLQAVAPTALTDIGTGTQWDAYLSFLGAAVNKDADAKALLTSVETRLQEFREAYSASGKDATVAIARSRSDVFTVYSNGYFISDLVKSAGLRFAEEVADIPFSENDISLEEIDMLSGDYLFMMVRNDSEAENFQRAKDSQLWQFLPAVEQNQAYQVNWDVWVAGWNAVGAHLALDDLFFYLLDGASASTPKPEAVASLIVDSYGPEYEARQAEGAASGSSD